MEQKDDFKIIANYLQGETPSKFDDLLQLIILSKNSDPGMESVLKDYWEELKAREPEDASIALPLTKFHSQTVQIAEKENRTRAIRKWMKLAAAIILPLLCCVSACLYFMDYQYQSSQLLMCNIPDGEMRHITLSDGTEVTLNSGTSLIYPRRFNRWKGNREVYISGEGSFSVTHDSKHPFIVHASEMNIRVLGTTFNVKAYPDHNTFVATLKTGLIQAEANGLKQQVHPNEQLVYDRKKNVMTLFDQDTDDAFEWSKGNLVFQNEPLSVIASTLARHFDKQLKVSKSVDLDERYSMSFDKTESLHRVLQILMKVSPNLKCTADSNDITIMAK